MAQNAQKKKDAAAAAKAPEPEAAAPAAPEPVAAPAPAAPAKASSLIAKMKAKAAAKLAASKAEDSVAAAPAPAFAIIKKTPPPVKEFEQNVAAAMSSLPKESITMPVSNLSQSGSFKPFEVPSHLFKELTPQEKAEKEKRENPTVDENGEHIQTVAEAKLEAAALQNMLDEGVANVDKKIALE